MEREEVEGEGERQGEAQSEVQSEVEGEVVADVESTSAQSVRYTGKGRRGRKGGGEERKEGKKGR